MRTTVLLAVTLAACVLSGCAASLVYDSERSRPRQDCYRIQDPKERQRCLESTAGIDVEYRLAVAQAR